MNTLARNVRVAFRLLRRSPAFGASVIAILGLGIAAATALFSVVDTAILRPLPFAEPGRLVALDIEYPRLHMRGALSPPDFVDYRASVPALAGMAATMPWKPAVTGGSEPERLRGMLVSPNFFSLLGIAAAHGRMFAPAEETAGREHVVVLADGLWRRRYGADPAIVGRPIPINGEPYTVVGVAPPRFRWGRAYGTYAESEIWAPFALTPARLAAGERGNEYLDLIGRLRPGATLESAQAQVDALIRRFQRDYPAQFAPGGGGTTRLVPLQRDLVGDTRRPLWILFGAVALLLVIACTNVAGLMLARAVQRRGEIAIRLSLGASRASLFSQLLAESGVIALLAAIVGVATGSALLAFLARRLPAGFPAVGDITLNGRSVLFAVAVAAVTAVAFGLVPLAGWTGSLRARVEEGRSVASRHEARFRRALVGGQIGLAALLLVGATLLAISLARVLAVDPGLDPHGVVTGEVALPGSRYPDDATRDNFRRAVLERLRETAGVRAAGAVSILPLGGEANSGSFDIEGRPELTGKRAPHGESWAATPGYFPTLRIPLRRGRLFTPADTASSLPVAVIDEALARTYFGSADPIGKRIDFEGSETRRWWRVIVGVVGTVRSRALDDEARPAFYVPFSQSHERLVTFVARVEGDPGTYARALRSAVAAVDPDQPLGAVAPLEELARASVAPRRLAFALLSGFALAALLLSAVGLYGVLAYSVARRRREIGVRMALGALPSSIAGLVLREGVRMIAIGLAGGLAAALLFTRLLSGMLFGVAPLDPVAFGAVATALGGVGLIASLLPARRAARTDPMQALRTE